MLCCRCNAGGKCKNCVCVKSKRQCSNCLPIRKGSCSNTKQLAALLVPVTAPATRNQPANSNIPPTSPRSETYSPNTPTVNLPTAHLAYPSAAQTQMTYCPLPPTSPIANPSFTWGDYDSISITRSIEVAYSEVVHWRKNTFQVPLGNAGKGFVSELSRLYLAYADGSALEAIALKACTVLSILLLQKPFKSSKH